MIKYHLVSILMAVVLAAMLLLPPDTRRRLVCRSRHRLALPRMATHKADSDDDYYTVIDNQTMIWSTSELKRLLPTLRASDLATGGYRCRASLCFDRAGHMVGSAPTAKAGNTSLQKIHRTTTLWRFRSNCNNRGASGLF